MSENFRMQNVIKKYGSVEVLKNINLKLDSGEAIGLIGPSGAGKTTILKIASGITKLSEGEVRLFGHDILDLYYIRSNIGVVMDNCNIYSSLSVYDNLIFFSKIREVNRSTIDLLLTTFKMYDYRNKLVKTLSSGMRQKVLLACAILQDPKLLVLDEPTKSLDLLSTEEVDTILLTLKNHGSSIIMSTHNMKEAFALCDIIYYIRDGIQTKEWKAPFLGMEEIWEIN